MGVHYILKTQILLLLILLPYQVLTLDTINIDEIHEINFYSKAGYCPLEDIKNWNCGDECIHHSKMTEIQAFKDAYRESQGYCGYNPMKN